MSVRYSIPVRLPMQNSLGIQDAIRQSHSWNLRRVGRQCTHIPDQLPILANALAQTHVNQHLSGSYPRVFNGKPLTPVLLDPTLLFGETVALESKEPCPRPRVEGHIDGRVHEFFTTRNLNFDDDSFIEGPEDCGLAFVVEYARIEMQSVPGSCI